MTIHKHDPKLVKLVLGELDGAEREHALRELALDTASASELQALEQAAEQVRAALRVETPQGLSEAMFADVLRVAKARPARRRRVTLAALVLAALLPLGVYVGAIRPEQQRVANARALAERDASERAVETERSARAKQLALERAQANAVRLAQQAQAAAAEARARLDERARANTPTRCGPGEGAEAESCQRALRSNAGRGASKPSSRARGASSASSACDANDPLCGL